VKFVKINEKQNFDVVIDYAHTPGSLEALYKAFSDRRKIGVLGNTGGGRDTWKRPVMGKIASQYCDLVILTNEDPYDENPEQIVKEMTVEMVKKPEVIMDRREAIAHAIAKAKSGDIVLITGKGTDPFIMGANGSKLQWSDEKVAKEELEKFLK
jgi:UDP-N-acetylmuramoyl-L-alanyl-D-glutamate--2,6-diaminopimelate ligase